MSALARAAGGLPGTNQLLSAAPGAPAYLGTIIATTAKDNSNTAVQFTIPAGTLIMLQSDADYYYLPQSVAATAVTTANGVKVTVAVETWPQRVFLSGNQAYISCLSVSGTANVKVWAIG